MLCSLPRGHPPRHTPAAACLLILPFSQKATHDNFELKFFFRKFAYVINESARWRGGVPEENQKQSENVISAVAFWIRWQPPQLQI